MFLGSEKRYPVELQDRARLHFPYTSSTYYHVESVLQKRLKRQDHPLLIVSIFIYNRVMTTKLQMTCFWELKYFSRYFMCFGLLENIII